MTFYKCTVEHIQTIFDEFGTESVFGRSGVQQIIYLGNTSVARRKYVEYIVPDISVRGASAKQRRSGRYD